MSDDAAERATPRRPPYALTIAATDSGGGAGVGADLKTMTRLGVAAGSVIVAVTAQNTVGVRDVHVLPPATVRAQFEAVRDDLPIGAIKLGMLATADAVRTVDDCLDAVDAPVVVDPVMVAASGDRLLEPDAVDAYEDLFAHATLVTPNADETEALTDETPDTEAARRRAADRFFKWGADAVLLKGGHVDTGDEVRDHLHTPDGVTTVTNPRVAPATTHGSGCTLSSAVAARLAHGDDLPTAVERGVAFVHAAIAEPLAFGEGGSVNHLVDGDWSFRRDGTGAL
jgi:hydroxymethylpyrimidine/phosphomethylpyrimidine kinase